MKILNFGSCNIDYVYSVDSIVKPGETLRSKKLEVFPGGKGLNQSIAVARAGGKIYHAGCIGNDGEILSETLKTSGVDISFIKKVDQKNGHAMIQLANNAENSIVIYPGSNECITTEYVDEVLDRFEKNDVIILQNEISNLEYIIYQAHMKGLTIVLNPSPINSSILNIDLGLVTYLILNETEAQALTSQNIPSRAIDTLLKNYPSIKIVLTLGKDGAMYADHEKRFFQPSFEIASIDTTAAGDTFTGYFVTCISNGICAEEGAKIASAAAAIAVSKKGAAPSIPKIREVYDAMANMKERISQKNLI